MLNRIINEINAKYISEAKSSPSLFEDMASMEKYMAESYSGRIFVELLQNADDCSSTRIILQEHNGSIIFANNGRPFDDNDIVSISRSGASKKERGSSIGYRGIGFKSTSYLSSEILIFSNDTYFTFSKTRCAVALGKTTDRIPTVRIPFTVDEVDQAIRNCVSQLLKQGYNTVFIFKNARTEQFSEELRLIDNSVFLFLHNVTSCKIDFGDVHKEIFFERSPLNDYQIIKFSGKSEEWLIINKSNSSLAFKWSNGKIEPCSSDEAIYHCFLPTLDKTPFPFRINADFSTDPSRKHISQDELTEKSLNDIALLIYHVLEQALNEKNEMFANLTAMIISTSSFSVVNTNLKKKVDALLEKSLRLAVGENILVSIGNCRYLPGTFENSEKRVLRKYSDIISKHSPNERYYDVFPEFDEFIAKYSEVSFTPGEIATVLTESRCVERLTPQIFAKIMSVAAEVVKTQGFSTNQRINASAILIPTDKGCVTLDAIRKSTEHRPKEAIRQAITEYVSEFDIDVICTQTGADKGKLSVVQHPVQQSESELLSTPIRHAHTSRPVVAKWRSAEQQCIELEKFLGNDAKDVSRQNVGYDIESITPNGDKRYLEVKLLPSGGGAFSMTNNEYTAAHQYGDNYYLCLIMQKDTSAKVVYVRNPLQRLNFEKRIRQWEWYCESYSGQEFTIDLK